MVWEWSHTDEAYNSVQENISTRGRAWLQVCYSEIKSSKKDNLDNYEFLLSVYDQVISGTKYLSDEIMAEAIWKFASEYRTCTNGGHSAYCCPYGCHTVSFNKESSA